MRYSSYFQRKDLRLLPRTGLDEPPPLLPHPQPRPQVISNTIHF